MAVCPLTSETDPQIQECNFLASSDKKFSYIYQNTKSARNNILSFELLVRYKTKHYKMVDG